MQRNLRAMMGLSAATLLLGSLALATGCAPGLPPAAADALKAEFPEAAVTEMERENEAGVTVYEVELTQGGKEIEVAVTADGTILELEAPIAQADLPQAVAAAIAKAAGGAKLTEIEREETRAVVRDGKLVKLHKPTITYEAEFLKDGRQTEVEVAPDGKILKTETETDDDED